MNKYTIRTLVKEDIHQLESFLSQYTETSMFLRSNMRTAGLEFKSQPYQGEYWGAFDDTGAMKGVLVQFWNGIIIPQAPEKDILDQLILVLKKEASRKIKGIVGDAAQTARVINALKLSDKLFSINREEKLYSIELNNIVFPKHENSHSFKVAPASQVKKEILVNWLIAYELEAFNEIESPDLQKQINTRVDRMMKDKACWALVFNEIPVSLAGFNARLDDLVQLGPVWTPAEFRSCGYARFLVASILKGAQKQGAEKAFLFTDHPAAIKSYEAIGFKHIGFYRLAHLKEPIDLKNDQ